MSSPSRSDLIRNLVLSDPYLMNTMALAAIMILNNTESSDEYDSEYDYEEEGEEYEDDEEDEVEEVAVPMPRKRGHSELRDETPYPIPQGPQNKRMRLANMPVNEASTNYGSNVDSPSVQQAQVQVQPQAVFGIELVNPAIQITKVDYNQTLRPLYTPEHVIANVPNTHPFSDVLVKALVDIIYRFKNKTSEKNLAIMATRMWREPKEASMYDLLSDKNKKLFFEKWVSEVRLGQWTPKPLEPRWHGAAAGVVTTTTTTTTTAAIHRLRPEVLKQIDASSKGRLDERVRMWLNNVQPN